MYTPPLLLLLPTIRKGLCFSQRMRIVNPKKGFPLFVACPCVRLRVRPPAISPRTTRRVYKINKVMLGGNFGGLRKVWITSSFYSTSSHDQQIPPPSSSLTYGQVANSEDNDRGVISRQKGPTISSVRVKVQFQYKLKTTILKTNSEVLPRIFLANSERNKNANFHDEHDQNSES